MLFNFHDASLRMTTLVTCTAPKVPYKCQLVSDNNKTDSKQEGDLVYSNQSENNWVSEHKI
jgi:hypothetical protein